MECKNVIKKLSAFQDNELSKKDRSRISSHLKSCQKCRNEYLSMALLKKEWSNIPPLSPTKSLAPQIMQNIYQMPVTKPLSRLLNFALYSFIMVLVFFVFFLLNIQSTSGTRNNLNELLNNNSIVSLVIDKENTSVINISEDIFESILINREQNE